MERCNWCCDNGIVQKYHDEEWGIPLHDDLKHFEFLMMEVMQCGLNWTMMLKKREIFKACFAGFDYNRVASFNDNDIEKILATDGMIKSRRKVEAVIQNARAFKEIIKEKGSFNSYIWSFTDGYVYVYPEHFNHAMVARNELSDRVSCDLKKRGFKFLGSVTVYSHLQACGIINDHEPSCFMYEKLLAMEKVKYIQ